MVHLALVANAVLMIVMPLYLGRLIAARRKTGWGLFAIGAATFVASQVVHLPFNWLVLQRFEWIPTDTAVPGNLILLSGFVGLSAAAFEEGARYLTYRFWARDARTWGRGLMLGAGHGGIEAIILGVFAAINTGAMIAIRHGRLLSLIPPEQMQLVQEQIAAVFATPWYLILLGAAERFFALILHLSLSLLVMQCFTRGRLRWLLAAILWHTLVDGLAVTAASMWGAVAAEAVIGVIALISVGIIFALRTPEPEEPEPAPLPAVGSTAPITIEPTADMLERSRYS
ncbi:MAG: YhfC family glutamic-type intramembrane protease [Anaerolineae bacterium]